MYTRLIQKNIEEALSDTSVIIVNGARQTGKSTLCKTLIDTKMLNADYITFDSSTAMAAAQKDPEGFLAGLKPHVVLDEIQRVPEILLAIKKYIDNNVNVIQVIGTIVLITISIYTIYLMNN